MRLCRLSSLLQVGTREQAPHPHHVNPFVEGFPSGRAWFPMVRCRFVFNKIVEDSFGEWFYEPVDTNVRPHTNALHRRAEG